MREIASSTHPETTGRRALAALLAAVIVVSVAIQFVVPSRSHALPVPTATAPVTTVSLTWDDGRASQAQTVALHQSRGMRATYYVNSDMIGTSGYYLTRSALDAIHAAGNEIGGHGDQHRDLTKVSTSTAQTLVCDDRQRLLSWYPDSGVSFSYPYGSYDASVEAVVAGCGYASGRIVGGVQTATSCSGCPLAESIPPGDPFALITVASVTNTTTLADLKALVDQGTGGWVIPVFHDLDVSGTYSVSAAIYTAFLDWLLARPDTVVRTVGEVMTGTPPPTTTSTSSTSTSSTSTSTSSSTSTSTSTSTSSTTTSSSTSTSSTSSSTTTTTAPPTSLLTNAGLETDANRDKVPDCWAFENGAGNKVSWSRVSGHQSRWAEQLVVRTYASGDIGLFPDRACAPNVSAGIIEVGAWYTSTAAARFVVQVRDAAGGWTTLPASSAVSPVRSWTRATARVDLPTGTVAVRFGLTLRSTGQLVTDDYSLVIL